MSLWVEIGQTFVDLDHVSRVEFITEKEDGEEFHVVYIQSYDGRHRLLRTRDITRVEKVKKAMQDAVSLHRLWVQKHAVQETTATELPEKKTMYQRNFECSNRKA